MSHRMLYKYPGKHQIHGGNFDYTIVANGDVEAALAAGWFKTTPEAKKAHEDSLNDDLISGTPVKSVKSKK